MISEATGGLQSALGEFSEATSFDGFGFGPLQGIGGLSVGWDSTNTNLIETGDGGVSVGRNPLGSGGSSGTLGSSSTSVLDSLFEGSES
jgi:hypothetical protein